MSCHGLLFLDYCIVMKRSMVDSEAAVEVNRQEGTGVVFASGETSEESLRKDFQKKPKIHVSIVFEKYIENIVPEFNQLRAVFIFSSFLG